MAKKTQGTIVYMQSGNVASIKAITGITKANPAKVTCSSHGYSDGDVVKITGVVGMQEVNDRCFIVAGIANMSPVSGTNAFYLKGVDSTDYTAYTSGGGAYKATMAAVGEVTSIPEMGGTEPNEIDVSHLQSVSSQKLAVLPKQSNVTFNVWFDLTTAMQTTLLKANEDLADRCFHFTLPGSFNLTVLAQVGGFKVTAGDVNSAYGGSVTLLPRGAGSWSLTT